MSDGDVPAPASERARIRSFVAQWGPRAAADSNVAMHPSEIVDLLTDHVVAAADAICRPGDDLGAVGGRIGAGLVTADLVGPRVLPTLLSELCSGLFAVTDIPPDAEHLARLSQLAGAVAGGYTDAVRDRLLDEQEQIKASSLVAARSAEQTLRSSEARFAAVFAGTGIGVGIADMSGRVVEANPAMCEILKLDESRVRGRNVLEFVYEPDRRRVDNFYRELVEGRRERFSEEFQVLDSNGDRVFTHVTVSLVEATADTPRYSVATVEDVSQLQLLRGEFFRQTQHDSLTGLPNEELLRSRLSDLVETAPPGRQVGLCFFDVDGFKVINDGLGRAVGNTMLQNMAAVLRTVFKGKGNMVARIAGDGFAVLVGDVGSTPELVAMVEEAQETLAEPTYPDRKDGIALCCSVGITVHEATSTGADELVRAAEITLHRAKAKGKAQWMLHEQKIDEEDRRRFHLAATMPGALETGEFVLSFDPVRQLSDGLMLGYQASLRWRHKDYGTLSEQEFLPLAEETGLVVNLGAWAIGELCAQVGRWHRARPGAAPLGAMSLSHRMACDQNLVGAVKEALEDNELSGSALCLQFPVSALSDPGGDAAESLSVLADLGVMISVEGFGGGANLVSFDELPISVVRMVSDISRRSTEAPVAAGVRALSAMAHEFGLMLAAMDVETAEELDALRAAGVDAACGQAVGAAMASDDVAAALA